MAPSRSAAHHDEELLRHLGQRLTPQRRLVLEIMRNTHGHVTAEDVAREVLHRDAKVSLASVYRILSWLTDQQLICVTDLGGNDLTYEYLGHDRHHHLICQRCGAQIDVPFALMTPLIDDIRQQYGFEPRIDHQAIFGTCRACRNVATEKD